MFQPFALDRILQLRRVGDVNSSSPIYARLFYNKITLIIDKIFSLLDDLPKILLFLLLIYVAIVFVKRVRPLV